MENFFFKYYGVNKLSDIDFFCHFRNQGAESCKVARNMTVRPIFSPVNGTRIQQGKQPRKPFQGLPYDLSQVCVTSIYANYIKSAPNAHYYVQTVFIPKPYAEAQMEHERLYEAAGYPPRCVMVVKPNQNQELDIYIHRSPPTDLYLHEAFVKTCAFLNPQNIMNGIVHLDPELTKEFDKQTVVVNTEGREQLIEIESYYVVPYHHVLAWKLHITHHWRRNKGIYAKEVSIPDPHNPADRLIICYLVCDVSFIVLYKDFCMNMLNRVDLRPLTEVGLDFTPMEPQSVGPAEISTVVNYIAWPTMTEERIRNLIPTLDERFISYDTILREEIRSKNKT